MPTKWSMTPIVIVTGLSFMTLVVAACRKSRNTSGGGKELNGMDLSLWGYASLWSIMVQLLVVLAGCGSSWRPRPAHTYDMSAGVTSGDREPDDAANQRPPTTNTCKRAMMHDARSASASWLVVWLCEHVLGGGRVLRPSQKAASESDMSQRRGRHRRQHDWWLGVE